MVLDIYEDEEHNETLVPMSLELMTKLNKSMEQNNKLIKESNSQKWIIIALEIIIVLFGAIIIFSGVFQNILRNMVCG